MSTPLSSLAFFGNNKFNLIQFFYLKKGEKLNKKELEQKMDTIESLLIDVGAKEIKQTILGNDSVQNELRPQTQDDILNEFKADDTETAEPKTKQNKLLRWVSDAAKENSNEITRHLFTMSVEAIQLELLTGHPLISQQN